MPPKEEVGEEVKQFQVPFSGSWKPIAPGCAMGEGDFTVLTNMRYTEAPGIKSIFGMSKFGTHGVGFLQTPSIGYTSQQMTTSGTQTLTVTGGIAPYTWTIVSGGGSLSSSTGSSTLYTAPATNANCANNPTIQVCEAYGGCATLKLAINAVVGIAYQVPSAPVNQGTCSWKISGSRYNCDDSFNAPVNCYACTCGSPTDCICGAGLSPCTISGIVANCNAGVGCLGTPNSCNAGQVYDLRTGPQITSGCCPVGLL